MGGWQCGLSARGCKFKSQVWDSNLVSINSQLYKCEMCELRVAPRARTSKINPAMLTVQNRFSGQNTCLS